MFTAAGYVHDHRTPGMVASKGRIMAWEATQRLWRVWSMGAGGQRLQLWKGGHAASSWCSIKEPFSQCLSVWLSV